MELLSTENLLALLTLTALEIVLGIDNIVVLAIVTSKLERAKQPLARRIGLGAALVMRVLLLLSIGWIMSLTKPLFTALGHPVTTRNLILIGGGLFLIAKATFEIHDKLESEHQTGQPKAVTSMLSAIIQIMLLDLVFSLDSVITAIGMARDIKVMVLAVVVAIGVMMVFAGRISGFIEKHPTIKILALSFLLLIGFVLVTEGFGKHMEKGYIYSAMGFSLLVEMLNLKLHKKQLLPESAAQGL